MLPLPIPAEGGTIDELRRFINYGTDENWILIVSFLLATYRHQGPHPVLALFGEQGSAKSTTADVLRRLVDPHEAGRRTQPKDLQDLFIAAKNSWVLNYDNLSYIDQALSDAFCQISTGGAMSKRALYTDDGEYIARFNRAIIINGIEEVMTRSDLMDRSLVLNLPVIPEEHRRSEAKFWEDFGEASPRILGAILSIVSDGLRRLPLVELPRKPRMADFAIWATACEPKLGLKGGAFMEGYNLNREEVHQMALASSAVGQAVQMLVAERGRWQGTATELLAMLNQLDGVDRHVQGWPKVPRTLSGQLTRLAPNLRAIGIEVGKARCTVAPASSRSSRSVDLSVHESNYGLNLLIRAGNNGSYPADAETQR
jgi:hypothetical protein